MEVNPNLTEKAMRDYQLVQLAIQNGDIESVLFLLSVHANPNSRIQDNQRRTPLHIAVQFGSEMIVRNLVRKLGVILQQFALN